MIYTRKNKPYLQFFTHLEIPVVILSSLFSGNQGWSQGGLGC